MTTDPSTDPSTDSSPDSGPDTTTGSASDAGPIDFGPAAQVMTAVTTSIRDDQLTAPTPCPAYAVSDLLQHVVSLTQEFTCSARQEPNPGVQTQGDGSKLPDGWRGDLPAALAALAEAWSHPEAYEGTTHAGPVDLPAHVASLVALNEVVVHAWDLARATGQEYDADPAAVELCTGFVASFNAPANGDGGLFGPHVEVGPDATPLDRLIAWTGRDPAWSPPA